jgi:hypothetical protein
MEKIKALFLRGLFYILLLSNEVFISPLSKEVKEGKTKGLDVPEVLFNFCFILLKIKVV